MNINEALELLESTYVLLDIQKLQPKDRLNFWINLKEFQTPKIQRSTFEQNLDDEIEIIITKDYEVKDED
jgi:hypothetical protein